MVSLSVALMIRLSAQPAAFKDYLTCFDWDPVSSTLSGWELGFIAGVKPRWWIGWAAWTGPCWTLTTSSSSTGR